MNTNNIDQIRNLDTTKTRRIQMLLELGMTRKQVAEAMGVGYGFVQNVWSAKVLNQLVKNNFLLSERGPNGGFVLSRPAESINLLSVYESVEGSLDTPVCTMKCSLCEQSGCVFGGLSGKFQKEFREYLQRKMVSDLIKL